MRKLLFACAVAVGLYLPLAAHAEEPLVWAGCGITKKAFMAELAKAYQRLYGTEIILEGGGAAKGIRRVADGSVDMGGSCRPKLPGHPAERKTRLNPVAWDALVVIVNETNPVENITLDQIRAIYEGRLTNWSALGGADAPIALTIRRGKESGVGRTLRELVWGDVDKNFVSDLVFPSSGPLEAAVETNPNAIGITGISSARKRNVKILQLEGREPSYENIKSGDYLLYRPLYLAYDPGSPRYREIRRFIDLAHSRQGREIIRQQGVVPYLDAIPLIRKQREQWRKSRELAREEKP